jgi:DNA recombination protein RmuC
MEIALIIVTLAALAFAGWTATRRTPDNTAAVLQELEQRQALREQELENRMLKAQSELTDRQAKSFNDFAQNFIKQEGENSAKQLAQRHEAIDKSFELVNNELKSMREYVTTTDKQRGESLGKITEAVSESRKVTELLRQDTSKLNEALAGSQSRGQWGERVADDVLRLAGFIEGVSYRKQVTTGEGSRPDFTFMLPDERILHMDVKMPMAAFKRYLDAESDTERQLAAKEFLRDTKQRIKEVTTRDYINPDAGTLDYTLVFIPNEQVYGFIHEQDPEIIDYALSNHVVICSPLTLFAVLAVMRQSAENFRLESRTREIQNAIGSFRKQWDMYKDQTEKVGRAFETTHRAWTDLAGKRERQLDKTIETVDRLRSGNETEAMPEITAGTLEDELLELLPGDAGTGE